MSQISLSHVGGQVEIRNGRLLGRLPAHSPLLITAGQMAQGQPDGLAARIWRAAVIVEEGKVDVVDGPHNIYDIDRNVTGRVRSQSKDGRVYTVRVVPGYKATCYADYAVEVCDCYDFGHEKMAGVLVCKHTIALRMARRLEAEEAVLAFQLPQTGDMAGWVERICEARPELRLHALRATDIVRYDFVGGDLGAFFRPELRVPVYDTMEDVEFTVEHDGRAWSCTCPVAAPCAHILAAMWTRRCVRDTYTIAGKLPGGLVSRLGINTRNDIPGRRSMMPHQDSAALPARASG